MISLHLLSTVIESEAAEALALANGGIPGAEQPPTALQDATSLRLSFKGVLKIANLSSLRSLRKLQLDNNALTQIEGLDCLGGTLEWLDLSFNALSKMDGLDALTKLTDLSLFNNLITKAEGLDACTSLQVLSLGNNKLEELLPMVLYVRRLPALAVLTLSGNPLCRAGDGGRDVYRPCVFALCPKLEYLDYQLVTSAERSAAREGGVVAEKLAEVEEADAAAAREAAKKAARAQQLRDLTAANLEVVETIVDDLFTGGPGGGEENEWSRLQFIPDMPRIILSLKESLEPLCTDLRGAMEKNAKINVSGDWGGTSERIDPWRSERSWVA